MNRDFMQGFAMALADLVRLHDQPGMAADVIAGHGFTLSDFRGVDAYDRALISKRFREEASLRSQSITGA